MKVLSISAALCCLIGSAADCAEAPLPEMMRRLQGEQAVIPAAAEPKSAPELNPEFSRPLRDPKIQAVIAERREQPKEVVPVTQPQEAQPQTKEQTEDISRPPLPEIGAPLSEELQRTQIVLEAETPAVSLPPQADQQTIANPRITVIDGKYLQSKGTGKDLSVEVQRDEAYEQFYSYSFNFQDIPPELVEKLQFSALDLALEYKKPDADLKELEQRLTELLRSQGLLYARAQLGDDPKRFGSKLVMINLQGVRISRIIINNYSRRFAEAQLKSAFAGLEPGGYLLKKTLEQAVLDFNAEHSTEAEADFKIRAGDRAGRADLVITVSDLPQKR